jgi:transcriptional regulator with XRE-family HTH domain
MEMSIGKKLKALRGDKTQREVAEDLQITKSALAMYERDERIPRDEIKVRIAEYYGESVQSLFYAN